jgi:predicted homoserine dehydrogenase-like protein
VSCLTHEGVQIPYDIRKGVWVCIEADTDYIRRCFTEYGVVTDPGGRYMSMYRRWHMIGLELGISVAAVGLRGEPTGVATCLNADVVATAKRDLAPGEMLDGEGGYTVFGKLVPAQRSLALGGLPLGLAHNLKLDRPVRKDQLLTWKDVSIDAGLSAFKARKEMEAIFAPGSKIESAA